MDLVSVESPALGIAKAGKTAELRNVLLRGGLRGEILQEAADQLVEADAPAFSELLGSLGKLFVKGKLQGHWAPRRGKYLTF